ncbi:hypothetical protein ILT06_06855 [Bacillus sp. 17RED48]|uniref:hypothetical protein n=1 Tax=Bacillus sp. 17RED48 TaxID=2778093 RepID=UPI001C9AC59E|nr:hypothetical protein [Bacillus sp. 17RED48]MBY7110642.1 hypothetical protein [Bacillus sp. 17RED48]
MFTNQSSNCVTERNYPLGELVPFEPRECRQIITDHQTLVGSLELSTDIYFYIFYQADGDGYVIASRENGRVLEYMDNASELFRVLTSRLYNGGANQIFNMNRATNNNFRLQTQPSGAGYVLRPCNDNTTTLLNLVFTPASSGLANPNTLLSFRESERIPPVPIPSLPSPTRLSPVPDLSNLDDEGPLPQYAPRATIGSALIPCIFVNDVAPLDQRIKQSPYYVLEYRQYWHQLWSYLLPSGGSREFDEITGIRPEAQENMKDSLDIVIGADWNLRFGDKSHAFR